MKLYFLNGLNMNAMNLEYKATALGWIPLCQSSLPRNYALSVEDMHLNSDIKVTINISGKRFEVYLNSLNRFPHTLLGCCEREYFYDEIHNEYYFDRDPEIFRYILAFYRGGHLHFPKHECVAAFDDELSYFRLSTDVIHDCCYEDYQDCRKENRERLSDEKSMKTEKPIVSTTIRAKLCHAFEHPEATMMSLVIYYVTGFFIAVSVMANIVETISYGFKQELNKDVTCAEKFEDPLFCLDTGCVAIFTVEYFARLYAPPRRCLFFRSVMSLIDVVAILPFYIGLLMPNNKDVSGAFVTLRVFRVFRIFKAQ